MATATASAAGAGTGDVEGYASGYVHPRSDCPHLSSLASPQPSSYPPMGSSCHSCSSLQENWACLTCQTVECGRFINGHMLAHSEATDHAIAVSYSDLSIWCFKCNAYLDSQAIPQLLSIFTLLYRNKFGEAPLLQHEAVATSSQGEGPKNLPSSSPTIPVEKGAKHNV